MSEKEREAAKEIVELINKLDERQKEKALCFIFGVQAGAEKKEGKSA